MTNVLQKNWISLKAYTYIFERGEGRGDLQCGGNLEEEG